MQLTRHSSIDDFYKHFISVCGASDNNSATVDSMFGDFDQFRKNKDMGAELESLEFIMLLKASEQKLIARYQFMKNQIGKYQSIITVVEASLKRVNTTSHFKEMANADLIHSKEMVDYHKQIFDYTVLSQSNQIVLHFAKEQGDQKIIQQLSSSILKLVESSNNIQNEIEKRSQLSFEKLKKNVNGLGKKSFFQTRFS